MNDQSTNAARTGPEPQDDDFSSDQAIENAALAGAAAIQRLVAERNNLRNRLAAQQRELAAMRAFNEELRRRFMSFISVTSRSPSGSLVNWSSSTAPFARSFRRDITARPKAGAEQEPQSQAAAALVRRLAETEAPLDLESESTRPKRTLLPARPK